MTDRGWPRIEELLGPERKLAWMAGRTRGEARRGRIFLFVTRILLLKKRKKIYTKDRGEGDDFFASWVSGKRRGGKRLKGRS